MLLSEAGNEKLFAHIIRLPLWNVGCVLSFRQQ